MPCRLPCRSPLLAPLFPSLSSSIITPCAPPLPLTPAFNLLPTLLPPSRSATPKFLSLCSPAPLPPCLRPYPWFPIEGVPYTLPLTPCPPASLQSHTPFLPPSHAHARTNKRTRARPGDTHRDLNIQIYVPYIMRGRCLGRSEQGGDIDEKREMRKGR